VELSYLHGLTHVSSCLNCVNLLDWIYDHRKPDDPFVLDNGHAALALYVVLEKNGLCKAEEMIEKHGTHASRDHKNGIWVSGGSLGQPITVAVGMALADKNRTVWVVTSDGSCMEGATAEALRVASMHCPNMNTYIIFNGYGAYGAITEDQLPQPRKTSIYYVDQKMYPEWLRGLPGHYLRLTKKQFDELMT
jgi:transketolase